MPPKENRAGTAPSKAPRTPLDRLYCSPPLLLAAIILCVFGSEFIVTVILHYFHLHNSPFHHVLDSFTVVAFLFPILYVLVLRPIEHHLAQRRRAEEELATERNKLRGILDAMPAGVCIVNKANEIEYANSALEREFGPIEGRPCFDYFHGLPTPCPDCHFLRVSKGENAPWEWYSEKVGKTYEVFETPLKNADGSVDLLALMRDITARKEAENELRASRERLRALSDHLQRAREEERRAIGREIHDELGQVLATVQLGVSSLADECQDHQRLTEKFTAMEQLLAGAIGTVRKISSQLRPTILDELGLADAIEWQVTEFEKHTGLPCPNHILLQGCAFSKDVATAIFRICQEALTNIIRHSGATQADVVLEERNDRIILRVRDNGSGITPEQLSGQKSLRLIGMRERAYMLGGRVKVRQRKEGGTVVLARIPCNPPGETR